MNNLRDDLTDISARKEALMVIEQEAPQPHPGQLNLV